MKKLFCDICNAEITTAHPQFKVFHDTDVIGTDKARVKMTFSTGFVAHPSGFGGPPDLCVDCLVNFAERFLDELKGFTEKG